jgi:hypothetical protein
MKVTELEREVSAIEKESSMSTLHQMQSSTKPPALSDEAEGERRGRIERNKSGPQGNRIMVSRRAPPQRSKSHKIGRPVFSEELPSEPTRGIDRTTSGKGGRLRTAPNKSRSFGKKTAPDRSGSTNSLKAYRKQQQLSSPLGQEIGGDGDSVCDSVFTSASNQTLDSIMLRKKQITPGDEKKVSSVAMRMPSRSSDISVASFEFDEMSLHTVDSINLHHRHVKEVFDDQCDLSVFSESFASTDTYVLSDYDEEEGAVKEVEVEEDLSGDEDEPLE